MASNGTIRNGSVPLKNARSYARAIDTGRLDDSKVRDETGKEKLISIAKMFTFADRKDVILMIIGTIAAVLHGTGQIAHVLIMTRVLNRFIDLTKLFCAANESVCNVGLSNKSNLTNIDFDEIGDDLLRELTELALYYLPLAFGILMMAAIATSTWNLAGYRQGLRIRRALFSSIVHQDLGWHDISTTAQLTNRLSDDVEKIQSGLGDRVAIFIQFTSTFLSGFTVAFVFNWRLALVVVSVLPFMVVITAALTRIVTQFTSREQNAYAKAGAIAEEVLSSIRTVIAFGGEEKEAQRYGKELGGALKVGIMRGTITGLLFGALLAVFFSSYSLAFWYGATLATDCPVEDQLQPGDLFTVFICIILGGFAIGQAAPELETFFVGRGSATVVYRIIDRVPTIDGRSPMGTCPKKLDPVVELRNVHFTYPSRPDIQVLKGISLAVRPGQTLALVGPSGCGKSTVVQLVQRFYDALGGQVLIGGFDIRELNVRWLRQHIGVVSQEPVLFATTIAENIRYGKEDVTQDEIEGAAKAANAHSFITILPDGYDTLVGDRGAQLSGGQKQRIAIARALVRDPKILLLDEATSALDTESEAQVQMALDRARRGRTTIVIAHRLSTVQSADMIAAIQNGCVAELGTHAQLMDLKGVYHDLVTAQMIEVDEEASREPLSEFRTALRHSQQRMSYKRQLSSQSSYITPEPVETPSFLKRQFSSAFSLDQIPEDNVRVKEDWNPTCLDLLLGRIERPQDQLKDKKATPSSLGFFQLLALNKPEWHLVVTGVFFAAIVGATQPTLSIVFSRMLEILGGCNEDVILEQTRETVPFFVLIGAIVFISTTIQNVTLSVASERLTLRLRWDTFKAFLRQDMSWFDAPENSTGVLTTCLATDTSTVKGATGVSFGLVLQAASALSVALGIAFYSSWHLTLVVLGCVPFIVLTGAYQARQIKGRAVINKKLLEGAGRLASQAIENIRTLHSLGIETSFDVQYSEGLKEPFKVGLYGSFVQGVIYGFSQCVPYVLYCVTFSFSRYLVEEGLAEYQDIFRALVAVVLTSVTIGRLSGFAPESGKARLAAARILELINRVPAVDPRNDVGIKPDSNDATIDFNSIHFNYPTRPEVPVLQGLDLSVKPGETVALVGPSGCGKSTIIQLLLRFYDPLEGKVVLDGNDVKVLNLPWLRNQIGLVSQEPVLFDTTIADNIRYGANFRELITDSEVEAAAKAANIHNFIMGLPEGYQTNVGSRGTQLSGGQKQRVAIARALIRDPKILLLDEATSALDTESEKIVQEALDEARQGRTSVIIAHRLSTIQNADCIAVIHNGQVIESGTHKQLMSQRGAYYLLSTTYTVHQGYGRSSDK